MKKQLLALVSCALLAACQLTGNGEPVLAGPASPSSSLASATPPEIKADGIETSEIRVILRDHESANLIQGGDQVDITTDRGTLTPVVDHNNGTYTANISSTSQGTANITIMINGGLYTGTPVKVTFLP